MVYVLLADGFEEAEALIPVDYLKRAGISVKTVGVTGKTVIGSHSVPVICDIECSGINLDDTEAVVLPGGGRGTRNLENSDDVQNIIDRCAEKGTLLAAICAAPSILGHKNLLKGKEAICYPGFEKELHCAKISDKFAVTDGNIITAKGAGAASEFAFEIITYLKDERTAKKVRDEVQTCY